ncbi:hypothetical protein ACTQZS_04290 [Bilifractor sp. LCP19S3_H10]|uniref:hypothetical protein n=1 Tax=Bilifractor sp. LCP19S3_H10 TaxID=3438736 RepID=UPI003F92A4D3
MTIEEITKPGLVDLSFDDAKELCALAMSLIDEGIKRAELSGDKEAHLLFLLPNLAYRLGMERGRSCGRTETFS